jgi:hypothetical protein
MSGLSSDRWIFSTLLWFVGSRRGAQATPVGTGHFPTRQSWAVRPEDSKEPVPLRMSSVAGPVASCARQAPVDASQASPTPCLLLVVDVGLEHHGGRSPFRLKAVRPGSEPRSDGNVFPARVGRRGDCLRTNSYPVNYQDYVSDIGKQGNECAQSPTRASLPSACSGRTPFPKPMLWLLRTHLQRKR